jgi:hypothetical protein
MQVGTDHIACRKKPVLRAGKKSWYEYSGESSDVFLTGFARKAMLIFKPAERIGDATGVH